MPEKKPQCVTEGVNMKQYMDDAFVIISGTILDYSGHLPVMNLPERIADIEISRIGDGSFKDSATLRSIVLPPTIKEIGCRAFEGCHELTSISVPGDLSHVGPSVFRNCRALRDVTIYDLELTADEYQAFKNAGKRSSDGIYVLHEMPKHDQVCRILSVMTEAKSACKIPVHISSLFHLVTFDDENRAFSLERDIPVIGFSVPSVPVSENKAFCAHIKNHRPEVFDRKAEEKNDWFVRVGRIPTRGKTILFTFDDTKTKKENGKFKIMATLKIGFFFWQSAQPVMYDGKQYYVYRRCYLSGDPEMGYVRRDIAVYTDHGLVSNREEAQNVYAKYELLSIL